MSDEILTAESQESIEQPTTTESTTTETSNSSSDAEKIMKALQAERDRSKGFEKELKKLQQQLKAFGDVDPELARKAGEIAKQQEEWDRAKSKLEAELEQRYQQQYQPQIQELQKQNELAQQQLLNYIADTTLEREFLASGGIPGEFEMIVGLLRSRVKVNPETKAIEVYDQEGKRAYEKGEPMSPRQLIEILKTSHMGFARHFKGKESPGFGLNGKTVNGGNVAQYDGMSAWAKVEAMRQAGQL